MKLYVYRIEYEMADGSDWGWELIKASTVDDAIWVFRQYYGKEDYLITDVLRRIGKESGTDVWKDR